MTDLTELLKRLQEADGPSRELDYLICEWAYASILDKPEVTRTETGWYDATEKAKSVGSAKISGPEPISFSIDAALALVERELPGAEFTISTVYGFVDVCLPANGEYPEKVRREDCNIPLAILTALIKAKIAELEGVE